MEYDFIFCDAVHDPAEIAYNLPYIMERSSPNAIWAFHDTTDENVEAVRRLASGRTNRAHRFAGCVHLQRLIKCGNRSLNLLYGIIQSWHST